MIQSVLEQTPITPEATKPVRIEGDRDGSKTLVQWLRTHNLLILALPENLDRLSQVVGLKLAIPVFQRVQDVKREEPNHPGFAARPPVEIDEAFERLGRATGMFR